MGLEYLTLLLTWISPIGLTFLPRQPFQADGWWFSSLSLNLICFSWRPLFLHVLVLRPASPFLVLCPTPEAFHYRIDLLTSGSFPILTFEVQSPTSISHGLTRVHCQYKVHPCDRWRFYSTFEGGLYCWYTVYQLPCQSLLYCFPCWFYHPGVPYPGAIVIYIERERRRSKTFKSIDDWTLHIYDNDILHIIV